MRKKLILILIIFPILTYAEYNGVHAKFKIELINGNQIIGYKYILHGLNTLEYKQQLEMEPKSFLLNQYTYEPGEYGYYSERLEYPYNKSILYKLINPVEIKVEEIKKVVVIDLITASYAIQILGDLNADDQSWMSAKPIVKYSSFDEMCSYETFIHPTSNISPEIQDKIKYIISDSESKIKKETDSNICKGNEELDEEKTQKIYKDMNSSILDLFEDKKKLKTITISICTD